VDEKGAVISGVFVIGSILLQRSTMLLFLSGLISPSSENPTEGAIGEKGF
jgi:hypothetical protein